MAVCLPCHASYLCLLVLAMLASANLKYFLVQIARMEKLVSDRKEQVLADSFCQKLVEEFK